LEKLAVSNPLKNPWVVVGLSSVVILAITLADSIKEQLPPLIAPLLPEVRTLALVAFTVAVAALFIEHYLEDAFGPLVKDGFSEISHDIRAGVEGSLGKTNQIIETGFDDVAEALAKEFHDASLGLLKGFSDQTVLQKLLDVIQNPAVKKLVAENRVPDAVALIQQDPARDAAALQQAVSVLVVSQDEARWREAVEILEKNEAARKPNFYLSLAFRFWSVGKLADAIALAEKGLTMVQQIPDELARFQNSLAYYYADADQLDKEQLARKYAEDAVRSRPKEPRPLDTLGYVKIVFAKDAAEIKEGAELCTSAWRAGTSFKFFAKHIERANAKLDALGPH
jgi:hypothetical protein